MKEIVRATVSVTFKTNDHLVSRNLLQRCPLALWSPFTINNYLFVLIKEPKSWVPGSALHFHTNVSYFLCWIDFNRIQGALVCCCTFEQRCLHSIPKDKLNALQVHLIEVLLISDLFQNKVVSRKVSKLFVSWKHLFPLRNVNDFEHVILGIYRDYRLLAQAAECKVSFETCL